MVLNPLQRYGLWVKALSVHEVSPKDLLLLKDIQDKLSLKEADKWLITEGGRVTLSEQTPQEELTFEISFSRSETELLRSVIDSKRFTVSDYDWLWPVYSELKI